MTQHATSAVAVGHRGPTDSAIRDQIIAAANDCFRHYGYAKTTVSDLAKAIGFSKAYIYKFFDSKQAIGEAIVNECLAKIAHRAKTDAAACKTATEKLRRFLRSMVDGTVALLASDERVFELASVATAERWSACQIYTDRLTETLRAIILLGRQGGEFERKTPIDETCRVILQAMQPFSNPMMLHYNIDLAPEASNEVISLILRSLAP
jgi:AcrR family transcriptional regulator